MESYIIFEGIIDQQASLRMVQSINQLSEEGAQEISIFFSSLGGNIYEGFVLATIIQNSKVPIKIHATNHIDSIANVIFMAAKERTAESHAKFYLHGAASEGKFDEKALREKLSELKTQNGRIASFVAEHSAVPFKKVQSMMRVGTTLSAQDALKFKIINKIEHREIPPGSKRLEIIYIN